MVAKTNKKTPAEICDEINAATRRLSRTDVLIGRQRDELHRLTITRANIVLERGQLLELLDTANKEAVRRRKPVTVIGLAIRWRFTQFGATEPQIPPLDPQEVAVDPAELQRLADDCDLAEARTTISEADTQHHHQGVPHLDRPAERTIDRSTSQLLPDDDGDDFKTPGCALIFALFMWLF